MALSSSLCLFTFYQCFCEKLLVLGFVGFEGFLSDKTVSLERKITMQRRFFQATLIAVVFPHAVFSLGGSTLNTHDLKPALSSVSASPTHAPSASFQPTAQPPTTPNGAPSSLAKTSGSVNVPSVASKLKDQLNAEENPASPQATPAFGSTTTRALTFV